MWAQGVAAFQRRRLSIVDVLGEFIKLATEAIVALNVEVRLEQSLNRLIEFFFSPFQVSGAIVGYPRFVQGFNL